MDEISESRNWILKCINIPFKQRLKGMNMMEELLLQVSYVHIRFSLLSTH